MNNPHEPRLKNLFVAVTALLLVWGIFGALDIPNRTYTGLSTDGNNTVTQVNDGSPAAAAGLQVGDVIISRAGVSVEDARAMNELGRSQIGETRVMVVDRNGQEVSLDMTAAAEPTPTRITSYVGLLTGLCFLFFGLWAYLKAPNAGTRLLAFMGTGFAAAFLSGPYFGSATVRNIVGAIVIPAIILGFAAILGFVIRSGKTDGYQRHAGAPRWIYWPAALLALVFVLLILLQPPATSGLNVILRTLVGLFFVGYFGASLLLVIKNYVSADAGTRASRGLGLMLAGTLIGLLPMALVSLVGLLSPTTVIPTSQYWAVTVIAIPIAFALAAVRGSRAASPPGTVAEAV